MIVLSCLVLFITIVTFFFKNKNVAHPIILFFGLWFSCILCASLRLYGMQEYSSKSLVVIITGLVSFAIGCGLAFLVKYYKFKIVPVEGLRPRKIRMNISKKMLYLILAASFAGIILLDFAAVRALRHGVSYSYIRNMYYGYGNAKKLISSTFLNTYINWISVPSLYALIPVSLINMFEKKGDKLFSALVMLAAVMYIFGSAGRFMLMFMVVQVVAMLNYYSHTITKKTKKRMVLIVIAVFAALMLLTVIRSEGASRKKVNTIYAYLSIPVYLLGYWLDANGSVGRLHGSGFFYGILTFFNYFTSKLGFDIPAYRAAYDTIQVTQDQWVAVFPHEWYNAYVSMFYYFYIDFGMIGVILGCILFGYLCYIVYYSAFVKKDKCALLYYMLLIQCIICSLVRWQLGTITMVLTFIIEFMLTFNRIRLGGIKLRP